MDPTANLDAQRRIIAEILRLADKPTDGGRELARVLGKMSEHATELAEHAQALDEWMSKGGFLPAQWKR